MVAATPTDVSLLDSHETEWRTLSEHSCNVLIEGAATATDAALRWLLPHTREPIAWHWPHAPLDLPSGETRTLILRNVAGLTGDDQRRLLEWMGDSRSRTRIVSTTARPLFALVAAGLFDTTLYYCLNVMLLRVQSAARSTRLHARPPFELPWNVLRWRTRVQN